MNWARLKFSKRITRLTGKNYAVWKFIEMTVTALRKVDLIGGRENVPRNAHITVPVLEHIKSTHDCEPGMKAYPT